MSAWVYVKCVFVFVCMFVCLYTYIAIHRCRKLFRTGQGAIIITRTYSYGVKLHSYGVIVKPGAPVSYAHAYTYECMDEWT